jgi:calcineurin-like phosphoesterase family protein
MNEKLIENHNKTVKSGDVVYHLGDFSFGSDDDTLKILSRLNGQHHLIKGNHDKSISKNPKKFLGNKLFQSINDYKEIRIGEQKIVLFHYSMRVWNSSHHGAMQLFGHSHGSLTGIGKSVDVGVDAKFIHNEYRPSSYDEVKNYMSKIDIQKIDHH